MHSTPPINAFKTDETQSPTNAPESPQDALYLPTDVKEARDEIDRLIRFLDKTDDYVSRELEESTDAEPSLGWSTPANAATSTILSNKTATTSLTSTTSRHSEALPPYRATAKGRGAGKQFRP